MRIDAIRAGAHNYAPVNSSKKSAENISADDLRGSFNTPSFKKKYDLSSIETNIAYDYGVRCYFKKNPLIADCTRKIIKVYDELFGKWALPDKVEVEPMAKGVLGSYSAGQREVNFNSEAGRFKNKWRLNIASKLDWTPILPNQKSSLHPAHIFAHEFAHSAHWKHLTERHGEDLASNFWMGLSGTMVPSAVGRLIIRYKLGNYAVDSMDMAEFMAERIAKDVCKSLKWRKWTLKKVPDVDYESIFSRKWSYRYTSPQSYIDYFTQQIWNGDREGALKVAEDIEEFLRLVEQKTSASKEELKRLREEIQIDKTVMKKTADAINSRITKLADIESKEVHPAVERVEKITSSILHPEKASKPEIEETYEEVEEIPYYTPLYGFNARLTRKLNKQNDFSLNPELTLRL